MRAQNLVSLVCLGCVLAATHSRALAPAQPSTAIHRETWTVKGLDKPAHITIDRWGIPHIFAASRRDAFFLQGYNAARDALLLASLSEAVAELKQTLGPDLETWSWGRLHHATFEPAVAELADAALRAQMSVGPLEIPGSASTPRAATYRVSAFAAISGASVRMVLDTGNWDNSVAINTPGESGDPFSPHYRDLFPLWAAGEYVPLLFSRAAVEREAETVVTLVPEGANKAATPHRTVARRRVARP
jgi:acyl-homoserine lactone acylase PvdQ